MGKDWRPRVHSEKFIRSTSNRFTIYFPQVQDSNWKYVQIRRFSKYFSPDVTWHLKRGDRKDKTCRVRLYSHVVLWKYRHIHVTILLVEPIQDGIELYVAPQLKNVWHPARDHYNSNWDECRLFWMSPAVALFTRTNPSVLDLSVWTLRDEAGKPLLEIKHSRRCGVAASIEILI